MARQVATRRELGTPKTSSVDEMVKAAANKCGKIEQQLFVELLDYMFAMAGKREPPNQRVTLGWYVALRDLDERDLMTAIDRYVREHSKEFLSPQLIIELSGSRQTKEERAVVAWQEVITAIRVFGAYASPAFTDCKTAAAISNMGGWVRLCDTKPDELHNWKRGAFLKTFNALPDTVEQRPLKNLIDFENARTGQTVQQQAVRQRIEGRVEVLKIQFEEKAARRAIEQEAEGVKRTVQVRRLRGVE